MHVLHTDTAVHIIIKPSLHYPECFCVTSTHATHCCKQHKNNNPEWPHVTLSQSRPMLSLKISYSRISVLTSNSTIEMSPSSHGTVKRHIEMLRMLWDCLIVLELASCDCCTTSSEIVAQLCVRQMTWLFVIFYRVILCTNRQHKILPQLKTQPPSHVCSQHPC